MITITSTTGVRFNARILNPGDRYGLDDCLTWDEDRPGVEFYDTRYMHTSRGQFVSRYYVATILGDDGYGSGTGGLDLMGYEPSWKIDAAAMDVVRAWLRHETKTTGSRGWIDGVPQRWNRQTNTWERP
jgi:hypothetical protein